MTDPIADMLTRVRNAVSARHSRVDMPASKLKTEIAKILQDEGYIAGFKLVDEKPARPGGMARPMIRLLLKYGPGGERVITGITREPARTPGLCRRRRHHDGARRPGCEHTHDVARGHDRPIRQEGWRWRGSALQRVVMAGPGPGFRGTGMVPGQCAPAWFARRPETRPPGPGTRLGH